MDTSRWPHLSDIASGLIDARLSGVDFWDTDAGQRLLAARKREAAQRPPLRQRHRGWRRGRPR